MYYAVGDIHGNSIALFALYEAIKEDINSKQNTKNTIIFLGDVIDRGIDNLAVLKFLMSLQDTEDLKHIFLMGNHETMMIEVFDYYATGKYKSHIDDGPYHTQVPIADKMWMINGGEQTLNHLNITFDEFKKGAGAEFVSFLKTFQLYYETEHCIFVHGCMEPKKPMNEQNPDTVLWGRINHYENAEKVVIHGHTPSNDNFPQIRCNEINVDTASGYSGGRLSCVCLDETKSPKDMVPYFLMTNNENRCNLVTITDFDKKIKNCLW